MVLVFRTPGTPVSNGLVMAVYMVLEVTGFFCFVLASFTRSSDIVCCRVTSDDEPDRLAI